MFKPWVAYVLATVLGLAVAGVDIFADKGELSPGAILVLLALAGAVLTLFHSRFSVLLILIVAAWLPLCHLVLHAIGRKTTLQPDTVASISMVGVVGASAALIGGLTTAAIRRHRSHV